jgi:uncharacterized protein YfaS (alpha-2-macroglobulin family)
MVLQKYKQMKNFNGQLKNKLAAFIKSSSFKPLLITVGVIALAIATIVFFKSKAPKEKKIGFAITQPGLPNLQNEESFPPMYIKFRGSVSKIEDVQTEVATGVSINPAIEGTWKWAADNMLAFYPTEQWLPGTAYAVELEKSLFPKHIKLSKYEDEFKTKPFTVTIASHKFHIDPKDEDLKQVIATISFSHPVNPESFEERIAIRPKKLSKDISNFKEKDYKLTITYDDIFSKAYLLTDALPIPEDDVHMQLRIDKGVKSSWGGNNQAKELTSTVTVPGMLNFVRINAVQQTIVRNEQYESEQVLVIDTKGKIKAGTLKKYLEVMILPKDRPESPGTKASKDHYWGNPAEIDPEIKKLSTPVELIEMESEHEFQAINSFKIKVPPLKYLYIKIKKGAPFYGKYHLSKNFEDIIKTQPFAEQLEIMHDGIILSSTGEKKVSIMAQGIKRVKFKIGRLLPDQINHLVTQSNGDLTNIQFRNYNFSQDNIVENYSEYRDLEVTRPEESNFFAFDFTKYMSKGTPGKARNGIFFFEVKSERTYTKNYGNKSDKRLIIVSDLGVLVKESANNKRDVFVQSIASGLPVAGAKVQVLGKNGIAILSANTNLEGHASFPSLNGFYNEKEPTAFVISKGNDLTFLPVRASGRWLNYSKFDVGGVHGASDPSKLNAYLFSERGIYRPGDAFNIGMIVKSGNWKRNIAGTPLEATIIDSRGLEIYKKRFNLNKEGFEELKYQTENSSPTGTYKINLYTIYNKRRYRSIGSTTISVEEFLPDRLSISSFFPGIGNKAWVSPNDVKAQVTLKNLFGSPAVGNRIAAKINLSKGRMWFNAYRDYHFTDPNTTRVSYSENLPEQKTDDQGKTLFDLNLDRFDAATFNLTFIADGFEKESGRNVTSVAKLLVSPLSYLIGTKANGDLSYIYKNSSRSIKVIAINPELKQTKVSKVKFEIERIDQVSVLTKLPNGVYAYKTVPKNVPVHSSTETIPATGINYSLITNEPGDYELIITDTQGVEFSKVRYTVVGMGNITRSLDKTAELEIKLNKSDFEPGEEIEVFIKAPYKGAGIITIERDKVFATKWFKTTTTSSIQKIRVPEELEGNGYINVSFVRAADSRNIYMTPLSYGIAPFAISKKKRINKITLDVPDVARSGKVFPIKYKTEKPCKIVVFAVDEGILQVANYKTPDPLAHFFKKRALEVKTSQLLDLILPEYSLSQHISAMGGGSGFDDIGKNLNPFRRKQNKPVVYWSGIIDSDQQERTLKYTVPDYFNGTIRVMAVAVSSDAIGTEEIKSLVRNPFVISPNVPMYAAPADSFNITVTVTNTLSGSGKNVPVNFEVLPSPHMKVYNAKRKLNIGEDKDTTLGFMVKVTKKLGAASLQFKASTAKEETKLAAYLSIRPAIPYRTTLQSGSLTKGKVEVETPREMYEEFRLLNASASFLPLGLSKGLMQYLDKYPYGCTEQTVSKGFPYLYLKDITGYGIEPQKLKEKISYALKVLQARQNSEGSFGIWAANSHTNDFITVYSAHFITQCKLSGYYVSDKLYESTMDALKTIANNNQLDTPHKLRNRAYAIYILTLNETITTNYIQSLRKKLDEKFEDWDSDITAGYIGASYLLMKQDKQGTDLLSDLAKAKFKKRNISWSFYDGLVHNAQLLYLLSTYAPAALQKNADALINNIANFLEYSGYNSLSSSYSIMALSAYAKASPAPGTGTLTIVQFFDENTSKALNLPQGNFPSAKYSDKTQKLIFNNNENKTAYYQVVQAGYELEAPKKEVAEGIEISRSFKNLEGKTIKEAKLGDEIAVHIKLRSINNNTIHDIAIVDLLPAGLEVVATSLRNDLQGGWSPDYIDVREDRVVLYGSAYTNIHEIVYKVRAINKGTFVVPPLYAESMYDRNIYGYSLNKAFSVE